MPYIRPKRRAGYERVCAYDKLMAHKALWRENLNDVRFFIYLFYKPDKAGIFWYVDEYIDQNLNIFVVLLYCRGSCISKNNRLNLYVLNTI